MPESEHKFSLKELTEILVRQAGFKEGLWELNVEFGMTAGNIGPSENEVMPAAFVAVQAVTINLVEKQNGRTVDAAKLA